MGAQRVVQPHQGHDARHSHLELHREDGQTRARDGGDVLDALYLGEHLFGGRSHHLFDVGHRRPGEGDEDVGHGHVDLRLLLARRDQHGEEPHEQGDEREQRRDLRALELRGDTTGEAERARRAHLSVPSRRARGSSPRDRLHRPR
jgi:hypothetical protein